MDVVGMLLGAILLLAFAGLAFSWWDVRPERGRRLLTRWGIPEPSEEQAESAAGYLRQRRLLHPFVFAALLVGLNVLTGLNDLPSPDWTLVLLGAFLATLLVAEVAATLRRRPEPTKTATLAGRRLTDVVPPFALVLQAPMTVAVVAATGTAVAVQPWADATAAWRRRYDDEIGPGSPIGIVDWPRPPQGMSVTWLLLVAGLVVGLAAFMVTRLTLTRGPITPDAMVDATLRVRTARVAVGASQLLTIVPLISIVNRIGDIGVAASMVSHHWTESGSLRLPTPDFPVPPNWVAEVGEVRNAVVLLSIAAGLLGWAAVVSPLRRPRLLAANP